MGIFDELFRGATPLIILAVVVLLFGATRLPALARSIGQSRNAFKAELKKGQEEGKTDSAAIDGADSTADNAAIDEASSASSTAKNTPKKP